MDIEKAKENLKVQLSNLKEANECGLATKGEFKEDIEAIETVLAELERLQTVLDERFIYVTGARTVYGRLMSLNKEVIVKDDLKLRNELNQCIKDEEKLKSELEKKDKVINEMAKELIENNIHKKYCYYIAGSTECDHDCVECIKQIFTKCIRKGDAR